MSLSRIVTIDGPAGVGKSTLAKRLAAALGVAYLDTGAMFRTVSLFLDAAGFTPEEIAGRQGPDIQEKLEECLFALEGAGESTRLLCNKRPVGNEVRTEKAGMLAAAAGRNPQVRDFLKAAQQRLGAAFSLVAEGRDMGTVVFPKAACKIFLDADPDIRAQRRYLQLREMGQEEDLAELARKIRERDEQDRNRAVAPLRPALDAHVIDTSHKNIDEVFAMMMEAVADCPRECAVRRKDRAITKEEALGLLEAGEYGIMSLADDSWPYAVPISYIVMDGAVYVHCAREGRKVDILGKNPRVCFTVVGNTEPVYAGSFSTYYESVMVFGRASLVEEEEEKYKALYRLAEKYLPAAMDKADGDIKRSFKRTSVYKIAMEQVTGKAKR